MKRAYATYGKVSSLAAIFLFAHLAHAQGAEPQTPGTIVQDVYNFALMIGGLLAFGAIVFGAIKYTLAAGNPSGQHEGREWITQALLGLLLLVGATLVLNTINPELITLKLPDLVRLEYKPDTNQAGGCSSSGTGTGICAPINGTGFRCKSNASCTADAKTVAKLKCAAAQLSGMSLIVTEGYPPTGRHSGFSHNNGCAVDIAVSGGCGNVQKAATELSKCGGKVLNEYLSCHGTKTRYRTGDHLHFEGC